MDPRRNVRRIPGVGQIVEVSPAAFLPPWALRRGPGGFRLETKIRTGIVGVMILSEVGRHHRDRGA